MHDRQYVYLHGFASSPNSAKAKYFRSRFRRVGLSLQIPDLNQPSFTDLTLTRQIQQVEALIQDAEAVTLIGSSLGGLTAAWVGERNPQVDRLVLLAPAFGFLAHWLPKLGDAKLQQWQAQQTLPVYHYGTKTELPLNYRFIADFYQYDDTALQRPLSTLILHGIHDDTIPVTASRTYAQSRSWVTLQELDSDHTLASVISQLWQATCAFCLEIPPPDLNRI
ncbi:YqiA/YcfP family alpha/beta fold hydrolase [Trichothermofontia sp.]